MERNINSNSTSITDINKVISDDLVTFVRMSMNVPQRPKVEILPKIGILVESPDNKKLFEKLLHQDCKFYSANGFDSVKKAVEIFNLQKDNFVVIGIIDADFRRISGKILEENIFMTDHHDTEIMLVCSNTWENLTTITDKEKIQVFENQQNKSLRGFILELIRPLSVLRWLNNRDNLGLKFKAELKDKSFKYVNYDDFIDENYKFSNDNLLKEVENKSQKQGFFKDKTIKQNFEDLLKEDFDLKELSNGHDFMNVLAMILKRIAKNPQIKVAEIETNFIFAYHLTDFQKTNLHQSLATWETQKQGFKILRAII